MGIFKSIFGDPNAAQIKKLEGFVLKINDFEAEIAKLSDAKIRERYLKIKEEVTSKSKDIVEGNKEEAKKTYLSILEPYVCEAFALTREAAKRAIGQRHFDVQLMGGLVLHQGKISEMRTGEGKTLVATLAASLNALCGKGVHIVTVNDYLAKRDAGWMGRVYDFLGLRVATIVHEKAFMFEKSYVNENVIDEKTEHLVEISI